MRAVSTCRIAKNLLQTANTYSFCMGFAPLDPRKHTTMVHNMHNIYSDLWKYGEYPDWVHICSLPARTYEPQVLNILVNALNQQTGSNITAEYLVSKRSRSWAKFLSKDLKTHLAFHEVYPSILGQLAQGIFVKESRLTWILEQKVRFEVTLASLDADTPLTVGDFINRYNEDIEYCVLASNYGFAAEIDQAESALQKHEAQQHLLVEPGVEQLKNLDKQHNNLINRFLAFIH